MRDSASPLVPQELEALPDRLARFYNRCEGASGLVQYDNPPTIEPDQNGGYSVRFFVREGCTLERLAAVAEILGRGHFGSDPWVYRSDHYKVGVTLKIDGVPARALRNL